MPRHARIKSCYGTYHIMIRSISDVMLFKNNFDKDKYLKILKKYKDIFAFKIYAYCLMSNHAHFLINCSGADVSKFMHAINLSYAMYFNLKYNRHGHLFQDRFKSRLIKNDCDLLLVSAYIHNNPKDIKGYNNSIEKFNYSSIRVYLGLKNNTSNIIDYTFILQLFNKNITIARLKYLDFINQKQKTNIKEAIEFKTEKSDYRNEKHLLVRDFSPYSVINFVSKYSKCNFSINIKYNHSITEFKGVCVVLIRSLCDFKLKEVCTLLGNMTCSSISRLCNLGVHAIHKNPKYIGIIENFIAQNA